MAPDERVPQTGVSRAASLADSHCGILPPGAFARLVAASRLTAVGGNLWGHNTAWCKSDKRPWRGLNPKAWGLANPASRSGPDTSGGRYPPTLAYSLG
jgi:hypothetical protein